MAKRVIRVTGKGQIKVKPDMTRITITLDGVQPEYADALECSAADTEILKDLMEDMGFKRKDVKTLSFNVDTENESYRDKDGNWKSKFVGYRYDHIVKVEFPSDNKRLGRILYALANNEALTPDFRFSFFVKDVEGSKNELLGKAVTDAKAKAEVLTKAAGVALQEIISIDYSWGEIDFEYRPMKNSILAEECSLADLSRSYNIDIEPDDIEISDTVTVVWRIG
ncbi:MAG: SIMPL domain-containing protein [Lachnospiraceae bacterium]|jgi:hypothetical protein|nr:SIMPL domain-containing protein [Lachnospiraceae bacterium]